MSESEVKWGVYAVVRNVIKLEHIWRLYDVLFARPAG